MWAAAESVSSSAPALSMKLSEDGFLPTLGLTERAQPQDGGSVIARRPYFNRGDAAISAVKDEIATPRLRRDSQ